MQRRNLGGADHENPLAVLHDFKRIAFKIAGQIETDSLVVAPHEVDQRADLDGFDAEIRIAAAGMQNVQGLNRSDQLRPEVLVDAERVFDRIDHRVFVLEFNMKRIMPMFRSKSESNTCMLGRRAMAALTFSAMVEVPTPALDGRNAKICEVDSIAGGLRSMSDLMVERDSTTASSSNGSTRNSRTPTRMVSRSN